MEKKKKIVIIIGGILIIVLLAIGGMCILKSLKKSNALKLVQDGVIRNYNTVTVKEVLEDYPRDEGSGKWSTEYKDINDEKRILVKFVYNDTDYIKFLPAKDGKTFKVFAMRVRENKINSEDFSDSMDEIYSNYMERHPDKGITVDKYSNVEESDRGQKAKIAKIKNGPLYKRDMEDYLDKLYYQSTIEKLELSEKDFDDDAIICGSEKSNLMIGMRYEWDSINDEKVIIKMTIMGGRNLSPSLYNIRLGDSIETVKKILESENHFEFKEEKEKERRINECVYNFKDGTLSFLYRTNNDNKIYSISYYQEFEAEYLRSLGYEKCKFITGEPPKERHISKDDSQYIFPESDQKYLSEDEVRAIEADKLMIGRNEIFARHGRIFDNPDLATYFSQQSWYQGTVPAAQFDADSIFNDFEKKNIELIKKIEDEVQGSSDETIDPAVFANRIGTYRKHSAPEAPYVDVTYIEGDIVYFSLYGQFQGQGYAEMLLKGCPGIMIDDNTIHYRGIEEGYDNGYDVYITWEGDNHITVTGTNPDCYDLNGGYSNTAALHVS